ncbi:arylsulfatase regulator [Candidatus Poribacteria bacterium]
MPLTEKQILLAETIDEYVEQLVRDGGDDEDLLMTMQPYMATFKKLLDTSTQHEMNQLCQRYDGFHRFAFLLEQLAEGIANGTIPVPE